MKKLMLILLVFPAFASFGRTNPSDECMFRADILRVTIEMFQGGLTPDQTKQQIWSQIEKQPLHKDKADRWVNWLVSSVYSDQNSPAANPKYNFNFLYENCIKNFPKYGGDNALLNLP